VWVKQKKKTSGVKGHGGEKTSPSKGLDLRLG